MKDFVYYEGDIYCKDCIYKLEEYKHDLVCRNKEDEEDMDYSLLCPLDEKSCVDIMCCNCGKTPTYIMIEGDDLDVYKND